MRTAFVFALVGVLTGCGEPEEDFYRFEPGACVFLGDYNSCSHLGRNEDFCRGWGERLDAVAVTAWYPDSCCPWIDYTEACGDTWFEPEGQPENWTTDPCEPPDAGWCTDHLDLPAESDSGVADDSGGADDSDSAGDPDECVYDSQCGYHEECRGGECSYAECTNDTHCGGCSRCSDNRCRDCGEGPYGCYC